MISYFDAHCDTIWRCMETGPVADYGETEQEQRAFFKTGGGLRQNCGHVDLLRDRGFARPVSYTHLDVYKRQVYRC